MQRESRWEHTTEPMITNGFDLKNEVVLFLFNLACKQALYLGLTRDLFWARAARRISLS